jgi:hypothetical protein
MTEVFLGRLVRQGHAKPSTGDALILMGDWCGSSRPTPLDRDTGIADHHATQRNAIDRSR